jgi:flagellin-like hook-associated protein FlgL
MAFYVTSIPNIVVQRLLLAYNNDITTVMRRISSGLRISLPDDSPAEYSIVADQSQKLRALERGLINAQNAVSLMQTAEEGVKKIREILDRISELSNQAANGVISYSQRSALQDEIELLLKGIDEIVSSTRHGRRIPSQVLTDSSTWAILSGDPTPEGYPATITSTPIDVSNGLNASFRLDVRTDGVPADADSDKAPIISINSTATTAAALAEEIQKAIDALGGDYAPDGPKHVVVKGYGADGSDDIFTSKVTDQGYGAPPEGASVKIEGVNLVDSIPPYGLNTRFKIEVRTDGTPANATARGLEVNFNTTSTSVSEVAAQIQSAIEALGGDYAPGGSKHVTVIGSGSSSNATFTLKTDSIGSNVSISLVPGTLDRISTTEIFGQGTDDPSTGTGAILTSNTVNAGDGLNANLEITVEGKSGTVTKTVNLDVPRNLSLQEATNSVQNALNAAFGANVITVSSSGTVNSATFTFQTVETGAHVRLSILQTAGNKLLDYGADDPKGGYGAVVTSDRVNIDDGLDATIQITVQGQSGTVTKTISISVSQGELPPGTSDKMAYVAGKIQAAIDAQFGQNVVKVAYGGSPSSAFYSFQTVETGAHVQMTISQISGVDVLFSEPTTESGIDGPYYPAEVETSVYDLSNGLNIRLRIDVRTDGTQADADSGQIVAVNTASTDPNAVASAIQTAIESLGGEYASGGKKHVSVTPVTVTGGTKFKLTTDTVGKDVSISIRELGGDELFNTGVRYTDWGEDGPYTEAEASTTQPFNLKDSTPGLNTRLKIDVQTTGTKANANLRGSIVVINTTSTDKDVVAQTIQQAIESLGGDFAPGGDKHVTVTASGTDENALFTFKTDKKGSSVTLSILDIGIDSLNIPDTYDEGSGGVAPEPASVTTTVPLDITDGKLKGTLRIDVRTDGTLADAGSSDAIEVKFDIAGVYDLNEMAQRIQSAIEALGGEFGPNGSKHIEVTPGGTTSAATFTFTTSSKGKDVSISMDDTYTTKAWFTFTTEAIGRAVSISGYSGEGLFAGELNDVGTDRMPPQSAVVSLGGYNLTSGLDTRIRIDSNPSGSADADGPNSAFIDFKTSSTDPSQVATEIQQALESLPGYGVGEPKHVMVTGSGSSANATFTFKTDATGPTVNLSVKIGSDDNIFSTIRSDWGKDRVPPQPAETSLSKSDLRSTSTLWITLQTSGGSSNTQVDLPDNVGSMTVAQIAQYINTELSNQGFSGVTAAEENGNLVFRTTDVGSTVWLTVKVGNEDKIFGTSRYDVGVDYVPSQNASATLQDFDIPIDIPTRIRLDVLLNDPNNWANASESNPNAVFVDVPTGLGSMSAVVNYIQGELNSLANAGKIPHVTVSNPSGNNLVFTVDEPGTDNSGTSIEVKIEGQTGPFPTEYFDRGTDKPYETAKVASETVDISSGLPGTTISLSLSTPTVSFSGVVDISSSKTDPYDLAADIQNAINNAVGQNAIIVDPVKPQGYDPSDPHWQFRFETVEKGEDVSISVKSEAGVQLFPVQRSDDGLDVPDEPAQVIGEPYDLVANNGLVMSLDMDVRTDGSRAYYASSSAKTIRIYYGGTDPAGAVAAIQAQIDKLTGGYGSGGGKHVTVSYTTTADGKVRFIFTTDAKGENVSISVRAREVIDSGKGRGVDLVNAEPARVTSDWTDISDGLRTTFKLDVETSRYTRADWSSGNAVTVEVNAPNATTASAAAQAIQNAINALGGDYGTGGAKHVTVSYETDPQTGKVRFIFTTVDPPANQKGYDYSISVMNFPSDKTVSDQGADEQPEEPAWVSSNVANDVTKGTSEPFRAIFHVQVKNGGDVVEKDVEVISTAATADGVAADIQSALEASGFTGGHHVTVTSNKNDSSAIFTFTTDEKGAHMYISVRNLDPARGSDQGEPETPPTPATVTSQTVDVSDGELVVRLAIDVSDELGRRADSDGPLAKIVNIDVSGAQNRFEVASAIQAAIEKLGGDYRPGGSRHVTVTAGGSDDSQATFTFTTDEEGAHMSISIRDDVGGGALFFQKKAFDRGEGGFPLFEDSTPASVTSRRPLIFDDENPVSINTTLYIGVTYDGSEPEELHPVWINLSERDPTAMAQKIEALIESRLGGEFGPNGPCHISVETVQSEEYQDEYYLKLSTTDTGRKMVLVVRPQEGEENPLFGSGFGTGRDGNDKLRIVVDGEETLADLDGARIFNHSSLTRELAKAINEATKQAPDVDVFLVNRSLNIASKTRGRESMVKIISGTGTLLSDIGFKEGDESYGKGSSFSFQVGGSGENIEHTINFLGTGTMGIRYIDVRSEASAREALERVKNAMIYLSTVETQLGSAVNKLWHRVDIIETERKNLLGHMARLSETDFLSEIGRFAKLQNLLSSSSALFAHSNLPVQQLLRLL